MRKLINLGLVLLFASNSFSQDLSEFLHKTDVFLQTHVANGRVDYATIHADLTDLNQILRFAEGIEVSKNDSDKYQSFWINAYNLSVIKGIINHFPIKSPLDVSGFFDKNTHNLAGLQITLNDIENKLLRAQFEDARIHFVLVCGAIGCPPLISEAYRPEILNIQLDKQTKLALNGDYFIRVNEKKKRVQGSEILKWYKEDFKRDGKKEIDFINKYRTEKIPDNYKLSYFTYDWNINQK